MPLTFGNVASASTQAAMSTAQTQAKEMGLGQQEANAMAITNALGDGGANNGSNFASDLISKTINKMGNMGAGKRSNSITPSLQDQQDILSAGFAKKGGIISDSV